MKDANDKIIREQHDKGLSKRHDCFRSIDGLEELAEIDLKQLRNVVQAWKSLKADRLI